MRRIFVDTAALIALGNKQDNFHIAAIKIRDNLKQKQVHFVTTSGVLLEFANAFSSISLKSTAISFIEAIMMSPKWTCITIDKIILNKLGLPFFYHLISNRTSMYQKRSQI